MRHVILGLGAATMLAACGEPLRDVTRLSDVSVSRSTVSVAKSPATVGAQSDIALDRLTDSDADTAVVDAALTNVPVPAPQAERRGIFGGMFNGSGRPRSGPDAQDVAAGTILPFGQIARVCGMRANEMGTQIEDNAGFKVFDSTANTTARRPFYVTGFDDNCARTFTGAVVVTGDVETHEFVRYRPSNERIPYSTTDNAYEALKARTCRVGLGQPCGDNTDRLNRDTHFITVYNSFGGTLSAVPTAWAQILVHDGDVMAMSVKGQ